jgi:hypothetical protein
MAADFPGAHGRVETVTVPEILNSSRRRAAVVRQRELAEIAREFD